MKFRHDVDECSGDGFYFIFGIYSSVKGNKWGKSSKFMCAFVKK